MKTFALPLTLLTVSALLVTVSPASAQQVRVNVGPLSLQFDDSPAPPAQPATPATGKPLPAERKAQKQADRDARRAAKRSGTQPSQPTEPTEPTQPSQPESDETQPLPTPSRPIRPSQPTQPASDEVDLQKEVQEAIDYLNAVRQNPQAFADDLGFDTSVIPTTAALKVDDRLMAAGQRKADYMASKSSSSNPFAGMAHVLTINGKEVGMNQWMREAGYKLPEFLSDAETNFECLAGQGLKKGCGVEAMKMLLQHEPHRIPMTGGNDFWKPCSDIGIGLSVNADGRTISMSVLVAYEG